MSEHPRVCKNMHAKKDRGNEVLLIFQLRMVSLAVGSMT